MLKEEKIETLKMEMKRNKITILALSETRWKDTGDYMIEGTRVIYSGGKERQRGVAAILDESTARNVFILCRRILKDLIIVLLYYTHIRRRHRKYRWRGTIRYRDLVNNLLWFRPN